MRSGWPYKFELGCLSNHCFNMILISDLSLVDNAIAERSVSFGVYSPLRLRLYLFGSVSFATGEISKVEPLRFNTTRLCEEPHPG